MTVFDRSWYGRVLVERAEGLASEEQQRRAYEEINAFERMLADEGTILVEFWLHLSAEERTDEPGAPWQVMAAESKRHARVAVVETVIESIEAGSAAGADAAPAAVGRPPP